jgi:hypothetical protein
MLLVIKSPIDRAQWAYILIAFLMNIADIYIAFFIVLIISVGDIKNFADKVVLANTISAV